MPSLVSVVIPVYNGYRFLRRTIDSVLEQRYRPIEVIVVDDGSVDASEGVIRAYAARVHYVRQDNLGVAQARNRGVRAAQGDFIAFLDQDDWWLSEKVGRQVEAFGRDAHIGLVHTGVAHYDDRSGCFVQRFNPIRSDLLVGTCYGRLLLGNGIFNSSVMVRRSVLDRVGTFDTQIEGNTVQDYDLWLRIARTSSFAYIAEELTVYRLHPGQGMWNARQSLVEELRLLDRMLGQMIPLTSFELRKRMAKLLDDVGVAHLDAAEVELARQCFARALKTDRNCRVAVLLTLTFLPLRLSSLLRRAQTMLRAVYQRQASNRAPAWANGSNR